MRLRPSADLDAHAAQRSATPGSPAPDDVLPGSLFGSWAATRWQYASREQSDRVVDVVTGLGGSVTLSLTEGTWVLTWAVPGSGSGADGGSLAIEGAQLRLRRVEGVGQESLLFRLAAETLALSSAESAWRFDGDGEEPADFVAVLVRL